MGYENKEINRQYQRLYYKESKIKNPEAYEERKEKSRLRYHQNKKQVDKPKRQYTKRNLKQPKKKDEDTDSINSNDIELVSSDE